jgi:protein-disulfide isomerase
VALSKKIYGTPTFIFPGNRRVLGAIPLAQFRDIVRAELANVKP